MRDLDLLVIGAGPAGYVGAIRAAQLGGRVCLVERAEVGGVCLNRGCIPTKTLTSFAELLERIRASREMGICIDGTVTPDLKALVRRKRELVTGLVKGVRTLLTRRGVTLIEGDARFTGEREIELVGNSEFGRLSAKNILVATGSEVSELPNLPFDGSTIISSNEALELEEVPARVIIVGAGAIGCEFAFIFSALGADVAVVEILDRALPAEDRDVSAIIEREFKKRKIILVTSDSVVSCSRSASSAACVLASGKKLEAAKVLVSVGRRFNTKALGLEKAGVTLGERGEIKTDDGMETSASGIYAAGDVAGRKMYAHSASREAIVAVENALGSPGAAGKRRTMDYSAVPSCTFTRPEVGSVGLTEEGARARGIRVRVGAFNFRSLGRAHVLGETVGAVKIIADETTDVVLGVHIVGPHATELIHEGAVAVAHRLTARTLGETIHAHPTLSEAVMEAAEAVHGLSIHSLG